MYTQIPHEIKVSDLASNCDFYFATADGKESALDGTVATSTHKWQKEALLM